MMGLIRNRVRLALFGIRPSAVDTARTTAPRPAIVNGNIDPHWLSTGMFDRVVEASHYITHDELTALFGHMAGVTVHQVERSDGSAWLLGPRDGDGYHVTVYPAHAHAPAAASADHDWML